MDICVQSDFQDYYDKFCSNQGIIYRRYRNESLQRGKALSKLREFGVKTIEIKQVSQIIRAEASKVVVYTDVYGHSSKGKKLMDLDEALALYPNTPASIWYDAGGITLKVVQIGVRRYRLWFRREHDGLGLGEFRKIERLDDFPNKLIRLPIFSIDYIPYGDLMLATDFNQVEELGKLGFDRWITGDEVVKEISNVMEIYNYVPEK